MLRMSKLARYVEVRDEGYKQGSDPGWMTSIWVTQTYIDSLDSDLRVISLGLELQLDIQGKDLGVLEALWLLLKSSV